MTIATVTQPITGEVALSETSLSLFSVIEPRDQIIRTLYQKVAANSSVFMELQRSAESDEGHLDLISQQIRGFCRGVAREAPVEATSPDPLRVAANILHRQIAYLTEEVLSRSEKPLLDESLCQMPFAGLDEESWQGFVSHSDNPLPRRLTDFEKWKERERSLVNTWRTIIEEEASFYSKEQISRLLLGVASSTERTSPCTTEEVVNEEEFALLAAAQARQDAYFSSLNQEVAAQSVVLHRVKEWIGRCEIRADMLAVQLQECRHLFEAKITALHTRRSLAQTEAQRLLVDYDLGGDLAIVMLHLQTMLMLSQVKSPIIEVNISYNEHYQAIKDLSHTGFRTIEASRKLTAEVLSTKHFSSLTRMLLEGVITRNTRIFSLSQELVAQTDAIFALLQQKDACSRKIEAIYQQFQDLKSLAGVNASLSSPEMNCFVLALSPADLEIFFSISKTWNVLFSEKNEIKNRLEQIHRIEPIVQAVFAMHRHEREIVLPYINAV